MKIVHLVCAARPNFMKIAPLFHALTKEAWCCPKIVHTGQHYDYHMSQAFFNDFQLPSPHHYLNTGSGTHALQTANVMMAYEKLCLEEKPDLVIVVGDVNSTMACAIAAKKLHLRVVHLEAGLRSFDNTMPEEINRIVTDSICDYHWTPSEDADENLLKEGISKKQIKFVGNMMIDSYCMLQEKIAGHKKYEDFALQPKQFAILTLHRPINVDDKNKLQGIMNTLSQIPLEIIFPVHPRTRHNLNRIVYGKNIKIIEPLSYIDFMSLVSNASFVLTDSGGLQEESTYLKIPCFTLRDTTERPITLSEGSNELVTLENLLEKIQHPKKGGIPLFWDGHTSLRIINHMREILDV